MPDFTVESLAHLRDPTQFQWGVIPLLAFVVYVYAVEVERRNWSAVLSGIAFWSMDWINEVVNALVLHFSGKAAIWTVTGQTSFEIMVGLTLEIALLFSVSGIAFVKTLHRDPEVRVLGIRNRWLSILGFSVFCTVVELMLHKTGSFHWYYPWWNENAPWLIVPFGYGTFFGIAAWVHDLPTLAGKVRVTASVAGVAAAGLIVFGPVLGWI